jgi:hypothetical protein
MQPDACNRMHATSSMQLKVNQAVGFKPVIFNFACNAIRLAFTCRFHPYNADLALERRSVAIIGRLARRYTQSASYQLAGDEGDGRKTVKPSAAQVFGRGFNSAAHIRPEKAYLPMHVGP